MGGIQQENNDDNLTKHSFGLNACELQDGLRNMGQNKIVGLVQFIKNLAQN